MAPFTVKQTPNFHKLGWATTEEDKRKQILWKQRDGKQESRVEEMSCGGKSAYI